VEGLAVFHSRNRDVLPSGHVGIGALGHVGDLVLGLDVASVEAKRFRDILGFGRGTSFGDLAVDDTSYYPF